MTNHMQWEEQLSQAGGAAGTATRHAYPPAAAVLIL